MAVKPIPEGYHTVTPYLIVKDGAAVIAFLEKAFGAVVKSRTDGANGVVMNAEIKLGSSMIMLADAREGIPPQPTSLYLYVDDADAVYARAVEAGGISVMEPADMFYGDRHGGVMDPASGNTWWIATHIEDVSEEEIARRMAAYSEDAGA